MTHCVPDFPIQMDDEYPIPLASASPSSKKPFLRYDGIMELFWQNGPVVMQTQNNRPLRKPPPKHSDDVIPSEPSTARELDIRPAHQAENYNNQQLFMQEDEMASWLHYPVADDSRLDHNFCADLLYSPHNTFNNSNQINNSATMQTNVRTSQVTELRQPSTSATPPRPPMPPTRGPEKKMHESVHFSKHNARVESGPSSSRTAARELTVVDSCDTPAAAAASRVSETVRSSAEPTGGDTCHGSMSTTGVVAPSTTADGGGTEAMTETSSPGGSIGSAEPPDRAPAPAEDRKRKGWEADDSEWHIEDVDYESVEAKKHVRGSKSTRRSRAAEVHNLSERRRRDRINEKMRALQELIPRCNKSDKASMLDEAIEYLKSLQLQVQMMSMGCGMVPMIFPGMQQYMPAMGMGMAMGMEMGMGMNRPIMPFPNMLAAAAASALPTAAATGAVPMGSVVPPPRPLHVAKPAPDLSRIQAANHSDNMLITSLASSDPIHSRIPNLPAAYPQFLGPHQMRLQLMQNQTMMGPNISKPSTCTGHENPENHQSGEYVSQASRAHYNFRKIDDSLMVTIKGSSDLAPTSSSCIITLLCFLSQLPSFAESENEHFSSSQ